MKKHLPLLLFLLTITIACKKREVALEQEQQQLIVNVPSTTATTKGSLSGTIIPSESISKIVATLTQSGQKYNVQIGSNGGFSVSELPEGSYTLEFTPNSFYEKPQSTAFEIKSGKNTETGTITPKEKYAPISCYVNEQYQGWSRKGYYSGSLLQLVKYTIGSGIPENDVSLTIEYDLGISLSPFNGPGTYTCDPSSASRLTYKLIKGALPISIQSTENAGSSATVIITSIDPVTRNIKGTFTAFLAARSATSGDARTITKGVINATY